MKKTDRPESMSDVAGDGEDQEENSGDGERRRRCSSAAARFFGWLRKKGKNKIRGVL